MKRFWFLVLIISIGTLSSRSMSQQHVIGRYTISDVISSYKLESLAKDTLVFKGNRTVLLETRGETVNLGKWKYDGENYFIEYYSTIIPFDISCRDNEMILIFRDAVYNKNYWNDMGVLRPVK